MLVRSHLKTPRSQTGGDSHSTHLCKERNRRRGAGFAEVSTWVSEHLRTGVSRFQVSDTTCLNPETVHPPSELELRETPRAAEGHTTRFVQQGALGIPSPRWMCRAWL